MTVFSEIQATLALMLMLGNSAFAQETANFLDGASLSERGVVVKLTHKSDFLANTAGGVARGSVWMANSEAKANLDLSKLADWDATTAYLQYHIQHGAKSLNRYVGSFAGVDNIETNTNAGQFFQAWLQKNSPDDSLSLLAGLYAIDSEFYVTDSSGLFLQPPYGMSAEMAQTGKNGPPVFPMGALALRVKYTAAPFYLQGVLADGAPGDPNNPQGTQIRLGDGTLAVIELGSNSKSFDKTALGLWRYSARTDDLSDKDAFGKALKRQDVGYYFLTEHTLIADRLSGFFRIGTANKDVYQSDWSTSLGLLYQLGEKDSAGIAVTTCHASNKYRAINAAKSYETVLEITYRTQLRPWLAVQPMLQRIFNPNMDATLHDALLAGMRLELTY
jgi:porin